jgi:GT2 family glycosyltransferase
MIDRSNKIVSVIIPTRDANDHLEHCLESLKSQTSSPQETLLMDNSFEPGFSRKIAEKFPFAKLCSSPEPISFCESLNKGIRSSCGDFILCLNDDAVLQRNFIEEALKGFEKSIKIGMVSGKVLRRDRQTLDSAGLSVSVFRTARERGYGREDKGQFETEGFIFGATGAAAFYRRAMLEEIKEGNDYFDPDFGFFYEDLDIAWRAHRAGWRGYFVPRAVAYHVRGGSVRRKEGIDKPCARRYLNDELHLCLIMNRYRAIIKNESFISFMVHLPLLLVFEVAQGAYLILFKPVLVKELFCRLAFLKESFRKRRFSVDEHGPFHGGQNQKSLDNVNIL